MNIYEVAERHKLSLKKLRAMDKDGLLRLDESASASDPIRATLIKGNPLPVPQLVQLIEEPSLLMDLGKYARAAETQVAALAKPENGIAPKPVAAAVTDAAKNDPEAVAILVDWLKKVIPASPVGHAYVATRLLLGIPASIRKYEAPRIGRALLNCRNHPAFVGWWRVDKCGPTIYRRPETVFDL